MGEVTAATLNQADQLLRSRLDLYCANLVMIRVKKGGAAVPFRWNRPQKLLHRAIEKQKEETGRVRFLVPKARKLGISTYIGSRFYWRTSLNIGQNTFILTHEDPATQTLFEMAKFMHDRMPDEYRPRLTANNTKELKFGFLEGGYKVGTAKNVGGLGRSQTLQSFHGSEAAFWPQAEQHLAGVMEAVPQVAGTEIVLESTANGVGGMFHDFCYTAERGLGDYGIIFLPWFSDPANRRNPDELNGWGPSDEELTYQKEHGLDIEQLCYISLKNIGLGGDPGRFCPLLFQEHPATMEQAFQATVGEGFIPADYVTKAVKCDIKPHQYAPRVLGIDIASGGGDMTRLIDRKGRVAGSVINESWDIRNMAVLTDRIAGVIDANPDLVKVFIDVGDKGGTIVDYLRSQGYEKVVGVNFGHEATDKERFDIKRNEMWGRMKDWFMDPGDCSIPDDKVLVKHIVGPKAKFDHLSRPKLESKDQIRVRLKFSPDGGDALALTFTHNLPMVMPSNIDTSLTDYWISQQTGHSWMTG